MLFLNPVYSIYNAINIFKSSYNTVFTPLTDIYIKNPLTNTSCIRRDNFIGRELFQPTSIPLYSGSGTNLIEQIIYYFIDYSFVCLNYLNKPFSLTFGWSQLRTETLPDFH